MTVDHDIKLTKFQAMMCPLTTVKMSNADVKFHNLMRKYFDKVTYNLKSWKDPICCKINKKDIRGVADAIMYYTGTKASFISLDDDITGKFTNKDLDKYGKYPSDYFDSKYVSVIADGYRAGPCGDH